MTLPVELRAVFLDVGGPVYDDANFLAAVVTALDELRAEQGRGPVDRAAVQRVYDGVRARQGGSLRTALATELLGDAGLRGRLHERTRRHWTHPPGTLYPDVLPLLRALSGRVRIGVLANQEATVVDALTRDGVAPFVDVWGVSALVGHEKPSPELFTWCLQRAGCGPAQAVHVGNRLDTDVRPAAALGLGTVWVLRGEAPDEPTPEQLAEPDLAVPDLTGLAGALLPRTAPRAGRP
ncbi:HAD family hydrolase [Geodermatophilus sabuli]|uniref:Putative hydrolase of the HAD superfamily n=1 Tax=Geodermatophilus sabuli TaxID=1564158 RepID=A0A285EKE1_9ACTN|nr:HAD family hydrolase [Geodermatophilus sabuli]MBB3083810.1 putative hydrolase of the HAD superfamily [Geodermatophilus sabuli]SNX99323.1 putative hydrolase of the HAD superfamily [Geodermatophilus sabuli]